jgi:hypothetical protein
MITMPQHSPSHEPAATAIAHNIGITRLSAPTSMDEVFGRSNVDQEWIPASSSLRRTLSLPLTSVLVLPVTLRRMRRLPSGENPKETAAVQHLLTASK